MDTFVKVVQWKSKEDFTEHTLPLYKDDTILTTLTKIMGVLGIKEEKLVPYIWSGNKPLRFVIVKSYWEEYSAHPFEAPLKNKPLSPEVRALSDRIVDYQELNFITYNDLANVATKNALRYYFPNEKDKFDPASITSALYQQNLLQELQKVPAAFHKAMTSQSSTSYTRAFFVATLPSANYRQWFEKMQATTLIPFVQLYEDINHIYYKISKDHSIPPTYFTDWTLLEKMKNQRSLIFYSFIKGDSYGKYFFDYDTQTLQVSYFLDTSDTITFKKIDNHLQDVLEEIQKRWGVKLQPKVDRFALKTDLRMPDVTLNDVFMVVSKLLPVFKLPDKNRLQKNILDLQYIRVAKYGQSINLVDFMKSKIYYGIPLIDIIEELKEYGIEEMTVRDYYEQILQELEMPPAKTKKNFKNLGLLMHITPVAAGFNVYIDNAVSGEEVERALFWTRATLYRAFQERVEAEEKKGVVPKEPSPVSEEEEEKLVIPEGKDVRSSSRSSSELSLGGAIGKKYQRYFKNMLEKLDPDLFAKSDNYARKCQISDLRQPVGITLEQKEKIDAMGYTDGYDNSLVYGSDPNRPSVYMCPKIWCPGQQIPLSYEKYQALGEKCPDPTDDPILLYTTSSWYNDPLRKHYVGFLKERGYNNLKLPCCFKTPKDIGKGTVESEPKKSIEDSYIIDKVKQIEPGRFGTLPTNLHEFLYPQIPYTLCRNTVKAEQCLLRKGIASGQLLEAISYLLDMTLEEMLARLDPLTFFTLENGKVCEYFLPKKIPKVTNELRVWLRKFPAYVKMFRLEELFDHIDNPKEAPIHIQYRLARQAILKESYYNFIAYLKSKEANNPYLLFDFVQHLGAVLVVWNRDSQNVATMKCPFVPKNRWAYGMPYILVMQQETYYEPLVLVDRDKRITQKIAFTSVDKLMGLLEQCPAMLQNETKSVQAIASLALWIENLQNQPEQLRLQSTVIDPQNCIIGFFCVNNLFIKLPVPLSLFSLKNCLEVAGIQEVLYWEEIAGKSYDIETNVEDLRLLEIKVKKLGLGMDLGTIIEDQGDVLLSLYTVPAVKYPLPPKLPLVLKDTFIRRTDLIDNDNRRWYKAKKTILTRLLKEYDTLVQPLLDKPLLQQLEHLRTIFEYMQEPAKVAVLLEELPYNNKELLQKELNLLLLDKPYYRKDDAVYEQHRNWVFTQKAVEKGLLDTVIRPTKVIRPPLAEETITTVQTVATKNRVPEFIDVSKLEKQALPTKWRAKFWSAYSVGMLKEYKSQTLLEFFQWVAEQKGYVLDKEDIDLYLKKRVWKMLEDPSVYDLLVEDSEMRKMWHTVLQKNYRSANELLVALKSKSVDELRAVWRRPEGLVDLDLLNISKILGVSFLVLHKGRDVALARGNVDELVAASKFIMGTKEWEKYPVYVLFKSSETVYGILVSDSGVAYYRQGLLMPEAMKALVYKHLHEGIWFGESRRRREKEFRVRHIIQVVKQGNSIVMFFNAEIINPHTVTVIYPILFNWHFFYNIDGFFDILQCWYFDTRIIRHVPGKEDWTSVHFDKVIKERVYYHFLLNCNRRKFGLALAFWFFRLRHL